MNPNAAYNKIHLEGNLALETLRHPKEGARLSAIAPAHIASTRPSPGSYIFSGAYSGECQTQKGIENAKSNCSSPHLLDVCAGGAGIHVQVMCAGLCGLCGLHTHFTHDLVDWTCATQAAATCVCSPHLCWRRRLRA